MSKHRIRTAIAAFCIGLSLSTAAFGISSLRVEQSGPMTPETHPDGATGSGSNGGTWTWDGADKLVLDNYDGGRIETSGGDCIIELIGDNSASLSSMNHYHAIELSLRRRRSSR